MRTGLLVIASVLAGCLGDLTDMGGSGSDQAPPNDEPQTGCAMSCHGADSSNAPPKSISGAVDTTMTGVGAHQSHLIAAPTWHRKVDCADCHVVPTAVDSPGHIDGDNIAEVTFGAVAGPSMWDRTTNTCTTHCHGQTGWGGTKNSPTWIQVDGTQSTCGSCHGAPPPPPHPTDMNCASCHPTMEENSLTFRDPASHINGIVDLVDSGLTGGCTTCHGSTTAAPPKDLMGNTARTFKGVGAHTQHLTTSTWHVDVVCANCHVVPLTVDAPGHRDGDNIAEIIFDALNPTGLYTFGTTTCSNLYCHGNGRASNGTINWMTTGPLACNACHATNGTNMSGRHSLHINSEGMKCEGCHQDVATGSTAIKNKLLHIDGKREVKMANGTYNATTRACSNTGCHGTKTW